MATAAELWKEVGDEVEVTRRGETDRGRIEYLDERVIHITGLNLLLGRNDHLNKGGRVINTQTFDAWEPIFDVHGPIDWAKFLLHKARLDQVIMAIGKETRALLERAKRG